MTRPDHRPPVETVSPAGGVTLDRLNQRASLLERLDSTERRLDSGRRPFDRYRELAFLVLISGKLRRRARPLVARGLALFAGGGFAAGRVVGRTDRTAGDLAETPFSPKDVVATLFHPLGIDPTAEIHDRFGRLNAIGGTGRVRTELLA